MENGIFSEQQLRLMANVIADRLLPGLQESFDLRQSEDLRSANRLDVIAIVLSVVAMAGVAAIFVISA